MQPRERGEDVKYPNARPKQPQQNPMAYAYCMRAYTHRRTLMKGGRVAKLNGDDRYIFLVIILAA